MASTSEGGLRFNRRMSDLESLIWALERRDPAMLSTMTLIAVLSSRADRRRLEEKLETLTGKVPRLRDRVVQGGLGVVPYAWEPDPDFSLERHVSIERLPDGAGFDDFLHLAAARIGEPLSTERPPWHLTLLENLVGGREAMVARLHHSYTDGHGAVRIALELFDFEADPPPRPSPLEEAPPALPPLLGRAMADIGFEAARAADAIARSLPWASRTITCTLRHPEQHAQLVVDLLRSLGEVADEASRPGSSLLAARGGDTGLGTARFDLERLRETGRRAGAKVNDMYLAGLLGGLARYHEKHGDNSESVRLGIPISTRADGTLMRNQLQGVLMRAPLTIADPSARLAVVRDLVARTRSQPWLSLIDHAAAAAIKLPFLRPAVASVLRSADVLASNLVGPSTPLFLAGALVDTLIPVGPRAGSAANFTLLSYKGEVVIGVNVDRESIADLGLLLDCLSSGFEELLN